MMMEGKDKPVDFARVLDHVRASSPCSREEAIGGDTIIRYFRRLIVTI